MVAVTENGDLHPDLLRESRLSRSQLDAIRSAGATDTKATVVGLDARMRPVLLAYSPGAKRRVRYALMRNGDPCKYERPLTEVWR